jgi:hypothetical protein
VRGRKQYGGQNVGSGLVMLEPIPIRKAPLEEILATHDTVKLVGIPFVECVGEEYAQKKREHHNGFPVRPKK